MAPLLAEIMVHHGVTPHDPAGLRQVLESAMSSPDHLFVLAETEDGAFAGMCALLFTYSTWSVGMVCELQDVIVNEPFRQNGVGQGMLEAAENLARERGCVRLYLLAEYWNLDAHAFYRSLGLAEKTSMYFERDLRG
jgi:GNAT superfamily N-acetyltransferase